MTSQGHHSLFAKCCSTWLLCSVYCWEQYFRCSYGTRTRIATMPCTRSASRTNTATMIQPQYSPAIRDPQGDYLCALRRLICRRALNRRNVSVRFSSPISWPNPWRYFEGLGVRPRERRSTLTPKSLSRGLEAPDSGFSALMSKIMLPGPQHRPSH